MAGKRNLFSYWDLEEEIIQKQNKSKIYRHVVRPIGLYRWPTIKNNEQRLGVMETKILRWRDTF